MKRLNNSQPLSVTMTYRPLTTVLRIEPLGNLSTTQFYSQAALEWFPDHTKTPVFDENGHQTDGTLRLHANYFIQDEDGLIDMADLSPQVFWYIDDAESGQVTDTDPTKDFYIVGRDLYVRKNFTHLAGAKVYCEVRVTDPRNSQPIVLSDTLQLNAVLKAEEQYSISLLCDKTLKHYPLHAASPIYDIEAECRKGAILYDDRVAWFWDYSDNMGQTWKAIDASCLWYVSGKNTKKLRVDMDYIESLMVRCRIGVTNGAQTAAPDVNNEATASIAWRWPKLNAQVFSYGGDRIFAENASMRFGLIVHCQKHNDLTTAEKKHWLLTSWVIRKQGSSASPVFLNEHDLEVDVPQSYLFGQNLEKFILDPNLGMRGVYDIVGLSGGDEIELSFGQTFAIRS